MAPRVLIVDDQREISRLLRSALETIEHGLVVAEAPSGEEAILDAVRHRVDLLVADFRLPGMTGIELMRKLKVRNPEMKVILITGVTDPRARDEISRAGADAYFMKPVPMADFLDAVERTLGLVRTIMPAAPVQTPAEKLPSVQSVPERKNLPDLMANLRHDMSAQAVALLNERGVIKAQAGELPSVNADTSLIAALMSVYSTSQKVSSLLGNHPNQHVHLFRGENLDLIFAPLGPLHVVMVAGKDVAAPDKWPQFQKTLATSQGEIVALLDKMGVTGQLSPGVVEAYEAQQAAQEADVAAAAAVLEAEVEEEMSADFDDLFGALDKPGGMDLNAFWDEAAEKGANFVLRDTISFDEASKLGLAPEAKS